MQIYMLREPCGLAGKLQVYVGAKLKQSGKVTQQK